MAKWTLPEGKIYTKADMDRALAEERERVMAEMEALVRKHIYHDSAGSGFAEDAFDDGLAAIRAQGGEP